MSKERARRRAQREHEAALRAAARAAEQERRERRAARRRRLRAATTGRFPGATGRQTGSLAQRRRRRDGLLLAVLLALNVLVWVVRPDLPARLGAAVVTVLAFPVLRLLLFGAR